MMDPMILAERLKTIDALHNAATCVANLQLALPTCADDDERTRINAGIDHFKGELKRCGERLLQLSASDSAARVA